MNEEIVMKIFVTRLTFIRLVHSYDWYRKSKSDMFTEINEK